MSQDVEEEEEEGEEEEVEEEEEEEVGVVGGSTRRRYLFLSQSLELFSLALAVILHDHHGGVDLAHRQVCGC